MKTFFKFFFSFLFLAVVICMLFAFFGDGYVKPQYLKSFYYLASFELLFLGAIVFFISKVKP